MNQLHFPWLELAIGFPLIGAAFVRPSHEPEQVRLRAIGILLATFLLTVGCWIDFSLQRNLDLSAQDVWSHHLGPDILEIDELNAPLMPLTALLFLMTAVATLSTKVRRYSFMWALLRAALQLSALACRAPWAIILLMGIGTIPPILELRSRQQSTRLYAQAMSLFVGSLTCGQLLVSWCGPGTIAGDCGAILIALAVLIRCGIFPFHSWVLDLFERGTIGTALPFMVPMPGVYAALRLLIPIAPEWLLQTTIWLSLLTALLAAGLALVQTNLRRYFCYLFLSHAALVLVGLELATPVALTGSLSLWLSVGIALGGFGLTLRSMESRVGPISLGEYHGLAIKTPALGGFFLLTGLASIGFPGTFGFVSSELILDGTVQASPVMGGVMVVAAALNGISVVLAYLRIFTGVQTQSTIPLQIRTAERVAIVALSLLILGGGLWPQPGIRSRFHAALLILNSRREALGESTAEPVPSLQHPEQTVTSLVQPR